MTSPSLVNPWVLLGLLILVGGAWLHGDSHGRAETKEAWRLDVAESDRIAAEEKARLDAIAREKESADSLHVITLEAQHAKELEVVRSGSAAFIDRLNRRLRDAEKRCSGGVLPETSADPSFPEGGTGLPEGGHGGPDLESADRLREIGLTLQAELRDCRAWVLKHGR